MGLSKQILCLCASHLQLLNYQMKVKYCLRHSEYLYSQILHQSRNYLSDLKQTKNKRVYHLRCFKQNKCYFSMPSSDRSLYYRISKVDFLSESCGLAKLLFIFYYMCFRNCLLILPTLDTH